jgi:hypothetical protein
MSREWRRKSAAFRFNGECRDLQVPGMRAKQIRPSGPEDPSGAFPSAAKIHAIVLAEFTASTLSLPSALSPAFRHIRRVRGATGARSITSHTQETTARTQAVRNPLEGED